jgi:hypothetical protein
MVFRGARRAPAAWSWGWNFMEGAIPNHHGIPSLVHSSRDYNIRRGLAVGIINDRDLLARGNEDARLSLGEVFRICPAVNFILYSEREEKDF